MKANIQTELTQALLSHEKVWANEEKTILAKNILLDLVEKTDPTIIGLLLSNDELKRHFFVEVNGVLVFKLQDFRFFLDKHSVNNSYTKYANRIGLTDGNRFLKDSSDIVLDFPFKDCVLNGGQSTEEGEEIYFKRNNDQSDSQLYTKLTRKRQEIFFNQTLAFDEIDRLFDAKAFSKFSRHTADGKQAVGKIKHRSDGTPAENLIIKGNNLIALHSLAKQFKGKIKLIYIDPPYNTENDSFKYNDKFSHSTWLTFMKNRLEIAKTLLADDGVIFIQCDNNEYSYLNVLLNDIYSRNNHMNTIIWKKVKSAKKQSSFLSNVVEYILVYSKNGKSKINKLFLKKVEEADFKNYPYIEENTNRRYGSFDFTQKGQGQARYFNGKLLEPPKGKHWIWGQEEIDKGIKAGRIIFTKNGTPRVKRYLDDKEGNPLSDLWNDDEVQIISANDAQRVEDFDGQKPEALIKRIIELTTNESDIVLDYHLGSGTTAAVAHKMNRQYIGIEQMDYIETLAVERMKKVIDGEQGGISKAVNWQGGGEFVYAELAPFNETAKQQILACEDSDGIKTLFEGLCERYFLKYNVSINEFSQIIEEPEFQSLALDEQKQMVLEMLDLNQMYVSLSEMDDEQFAGCLNDDDKALSRAFYQAEKKDGE
ncbi:TPA: DNA methyltransferase [Haemophilus influenzae]|nr:site-specific DNA-methyltransferase [Haemophilus influenzae]AGV11544.1 type III restriction-modification system methylase [Haemophilus influenzae KR494]MCK8820274.1 site-specific DNA-methyltransferase [Haemophilus influenzae]MCK8880561.1 site-specific DNA-methyltransferase [Haemophilus influenzae]MDF3118792.1 site-specific DNA-methyltransferase [Haemophilus influenzae]OXS17677.1 type III restriction endonuclease subunit M [Haemophilus influenzae]